MAEATPAAAAPVSAPAMPTAPGSPAADFKVPSGYRLTPESEYETLSRTAQKGRDADRWFGVAKEMGFNDPDSLRNWKPAFDVFAKRKIDPKFIVGAFGDMQESQDNDEPNAKSAFDPAAFEKKIREDLKRERMQELHEESLKGTDKHLERVIKEIHGDKSLSPEEKWLWENAARNALNGARSMYPEGHPLRDYDLMPVDEKVTAGVLESIRKIQADSRAAQVAAKAEKLAASPKPSATVAGPGTGQGAPAPNNTMRSGGRPSIESLTAAAELKMARRRAG